MFCWHKWTKWHTGPAALAQVRECQKCGKIESRETAPFLKTKEEKVEVLDTTSIEITSIGKLREAIKDLPDDREIISQIQARDGTCFTVFLFFKPRVSERSATSLIHGTHPDLQSMIPVQALDDQT